MLRHVFRVFIIFIIPFRIQILCQAIYDHDTNDDAIKHLAHDFPFGYKPPSVRRTVSTAEDTNPKIEPVPAINAVWSQIINNEKILNTFLTELQQSRVSEAETWPRNEDSQESNDFYIDSSYKGPPEHFLSQNEFNLFPEYRENAREDRDKRDSRLCGSISEYIKPRINNGMDIPQGYSYWPRQFEINRCVSTKPFEKYMACSDCGFVCQEILRTEKFIYKMNDSVWLSRVMSIPISCELRRSY